MSDDENETNDGAEHEGAAVEVADVEQAGVEAASFDEVSDKGISSNDSELNLDVILDVPVTVSMEVGNTKISIRNLLPVSYTHLTLPTNREV